MAASNDSLTSDVVDGIYIVRATRQPSVAEVKYAVVASSKSKARSRLWNVTLFNLTSDDVRKVVAHVGKQLDPPTKMALVASEDQSFGLSRRFQSYAENFKSVAH